MPARPLPGSPVLNPLDLYSQNGVLNLSMTLQNAQGSDGFMHYCYVYMYQGQPVEAPTLRLNPGVTLNLSFTDNIQAPYDKSGPGPKKAYMEKMMHMTVPEQHQHGGPPDDCNGTMVLPGSTNIHWHGLNITPICHQDDVINTIIQSGDPAFTYNFQVPANDSPGMYWYHPHVHGNTTTQVDGGAAGAFIIEGNIQGTQGLPERVLVIRQQFNNPNSWLPGPNQLTINYQPAIYPFAPSPIINTTYGQAEFWRVVNASTQAFLTLQVQFGTTPQPLEVLAFDGIPSTTPIYETTVIFHRRAAPNSLRPVFPWARPVRSSLKDSTPARSAIRIRSSR